MMKMLELNNSLDKLYSKEIFVKFLNLGKKEFEK
jgi:hypothetical protein